VETGRWSRLRRDAAPHQGCTRREFIAVSTPGRRRLLRLLAREILRPITTPFVETLAPTTVIGSSPSMARKNRISHPTARLNGGVGFDEEDGEVLWLSMRYPGASNSVYLVQEASV